MTRRFFALLLLASGLLAGSAHASIDVPPETPIGGDEVTFDTPDGVTLHGNLFPSKVKAKGAILFVHEPNRSSRDWAYLAEKMSRKGFVGLVFDLRGHGRSVMQGDEELDRELFGDEEFQSMIDDVRVATDHLRGAKGVGELPIHVAGADLGGSLSLLLANENEHVRTVAMLSPGLGYDGVSVVGQAKKLGKKPLLLVFSMEDGYARKSVEVLQKEASGPVHTETYYGAGSGTKMLSREPKLEVLMTSWFLGTVIDLEGRTLEDAGKPVAQEAEADQSVDAGAQREKMEAQRKASEASKKSAKGVGDEDEPKRFPAGDDRR